MTDEQFKAWVVQRAKALGFVAAGVAVAGPAPHAEAFRRFLAAGRCASMAYMVEHADKRCDVTVAWPWARSVVCLAASYATGAPDDAPAAVARYARGRDYHRVLKRLCHQLADEMAARRPGLQARSCVDTAPILERDWAAAAGLGWIGANGCLIHPTYGSYLLLAEIVVDAELPPDSPLPDGCGACRACLEACPNGALTAPRVCDARRCASWATIENRGELDGERVSLGGVVFGCDRCQEVCPYNRSVPAGRIPDLLEPKPAAAAEVGAILRWSPADWDAATRGSATRRASWAMFLRNAAVAAGQGGVVEMIEPLETLAGCEDRMVRRAAVWALGRLRGRDG